MREARNPSAEMPFTHHLAELRARLLRIFLGVSVMTIVTYNWAEALFAFLTGPIRGSFGDFELIGTGPSEAFVCKLKVAIAAGVLLSCPYTFYQLWLFVVPGLHDHEKKFALPFIVGTSLCFILGTAFCFYVVMPFAFQFFFEEYVSIGVRANIRIGEYLSAIVKMCLVFGGVFELPILSFFLARMRLLSHEFLLKNFRYAVVIIFIVAAILTPPDVVTQCLLAAPLLVIYGLCIGVAKYATPKPSTPSASGPAGNPGANPGQ